MHPILHYQLYLRSLISDLSDPAIMAKFYMTVITECQMKRAHCPLLVLGRSETLDAAVLARPSSTRPDIQNLKYYQQHYPIYV
jgi:hypothetical protein